MSTAFLGGDPDACPMPGRGDLMSLSTINNKVDNVKTTTGRFQTIRSVSNNLATSDIQGRYTASLQTNFCNAQGPSQNCMAQSRLRSKSSTTPTGILKGQAHELSTLDSTNKRPIFRLAISLAPSHR